MPAAASLFVVRCQQRPTRWDSQGGAAGSSDPLRKRPPSEVELVLDRFVGIPTSQQRNRPLRSPKWKSASTIVENEFHSPRFFQGNPILFLTLVAAFGYHRCSSFGRDPIEPRKLRQPNPPDRPSGKGTALRKDCGEGIMSVDPQGPDGTQKAELHPGGCEAGRPEGVIHRTPFPRTVLYVATGKRS